MKLMLILIRKRGRMTKKRMMETKSIKLRSN